MVSLLLTDGGEGAEEDEVRGISIEGAALRAEGEELAAEGV